MSATVLVVDDSPENRYAARRHLSRAGFEIWEAETGAEGLGRAAEDPDLILLDVHLPDLDGFEVCRRLKTSERTRHIPVLQRSQSHVDDAARVHGLESGADAYLTEPVDPAVLVATARALLRVRRAENRLRQEIERAETLNRVSAALTSAVTREEVAAAVAAFARSEVGARDASVYLLDERARWLRLAYTTFAGAIDRRLARIFAADDFPVAAAVRTGEPRFGDAERVAREVESYGGGSWGVVPLVAFGRPLGALAVTFPHDEILPEAGRALLVDLAALCAHALERAGLYEHQRHIALTLQAGLLPRRLPAIAGVEVAARYNAGGEAIEVGGDFYDVFAAGEDWVAVMGDVCGRGAEAAALTSLARHTIRALAQHVARPSEILSALHGAILADAEDDSMRFITAACARLTPGFAPRLALGGHPPALIVRADGRVDAFESTGPLLGIGELEHIGDVEARLEPGDALVLYTDGVIEARRDRELFGEDRLRALLEGMGGHAAEEIADAILAATVAHAGALDDDVAILIVRRDAAVASAAELSGACRS
jgi:DNA-binding response OmpR family regulator